MIRPVSTPSTPLRVGVIFGGRSSEREVSLSSGRQVYYNLDRGRYQRVAIFMDSRGRLWRLPEKLVLQNTCGDIEARIAAEAEALPYESLGRHVDVAFNALHGKYGDDGCIQGVLELVGVPYTGSGVLACAVSLDKPTAHRLMAGAGFLVPPSLVVTERDWRQRPRQVTDAITARVGWPAVVLPAREGSSLGVTVVAEPAAIAAALESAFAFDTSALVEAYLDGMEFSVILLGNDEIESLLPTETTSEHEILTYDDKYMPGRSQKITPARVSPETIQHLQGEAVRLYRALGFRGYARLDGFLMSDGRVLFTDPNSTSGMAPSSFMFHQAAEAGLTAGALIDRIVRLALEAHAAKRGPLA